jgi:hypothetical protein
MGGQQLDNFLKILYRKYPEKCDKFVKKELSRSGQQETRVFSLEEEFVRLMKEDLWSSSEVMPKSVQLTHGEGFSYGEGDTYWIDFQPVMDAEVQGDKVVLTHFSAAEVTEMVEMAKEAGVTNTTLQLGFWEDQE